MIHRIFRLGAASTATVMAALLVMSLVSPPARAGKGPVGRLEIEAGTDEAWCGSGPVQCGDDGTGHSYSKATAGGHNLVKVAVAVTRNGEPVSGLLGTNFFLGGASGPAGGHGLAFCHHGTVCGKRSDFFSEDHSTGVYTMFAHPSIVTTWRAGTHFTTVRVVLPDGESASALIRIDIAPS